MNDWIDFGLVPRFCRRKDRCLPALHNVATAGWNATAPTCSFPTRPTRPAIAILQELEEWTRLSNQKIERVFARYLPKQNAERSAPQLISGDASAPLQRTVVERGVCYAIGFRRRIFRRTLSRPARESSNSSGAPPRVVSSIVSPTPAPSPSLPDWPGPRRSASIFPANRSTAAATILSSTSWRRTAIASSPTTSLAVLPRLARKGERFDAIILDPPTFSRSRTGKAWQVEHDFERLLLDRARAGGARCEDSALDQLHPSRRARARGDGPILP